MQGRVLRQIMRGEGKVGYMKNFQDEWKSNMTAKEFRDHWINNMTNFQDQWKGNMKYPTRPQQQALKNFRISGRAI